MGNFQILKRPILLSTIVLLYLVVSYHILDVNGFFDKNSSKKKNKHDIPGPIKTVVLVVMENRSFDHMLGWLRKYRPDIDGLMGHESNRMNVSDPSSPEIFVSDDASYVDLDPGHSFEEIREQIFGSSETSGKQPQMNGFVQQAQSIGGLGMAKSVMSAFDPSSVPVYASLADEFAVFDRWFASVPASTQPNRLFVHSATSHGLSSNIHFSGDLLAGLPQKTIFDSIDEDGLSFGIYYQNIPAVLFLRSLRRLKHMNKFHSYKHAFKEHARRGTLPNYAVIEQHYFDTKNSPANDDHPSHDVSEGQKFIKEIYETLRASPQWNESALIITYDEHGGFYDHVPTPGKGVPSPDSISGPAPFHFKFDRLGIRVPTFLISPWIEKKTVIHEPDGPTPTSQYEHSSIPATVKNLFNLTSDYLTRRDAWAGTFEKYFTMRNSPRTDCPEKLPEVNKKMRQSAPKEAASLSQFQKEMMALASKLRGDRLLQELFEEMVNSMDVGEASRYTSKAVEMFWKREMKRLTLPEMSRADYKSCLDWEIRKVGLLCL